MSLGSGVIVAPLRVPIRLCPPVVIVPLRSGPLEAVLPATIVLVSVTVPLTSL